MAPKKGYGVKASEQEFRRTQCFLACMLGFTAFGTCCLSLNSLRWSVFDSKHDHILDSAVAGMPDVRVSGRLGLYRYEMMLGDNSTVGETVQGRVNNGASTALCNMNTYNMKRDWEETEHRDDCDRYFDASSDANFFGVAAAIFGLFGSIWGMLCSMSDTEEETIVHRRCCCGRVLTVAPIFTTVAVVCTVVSAWSYGNQRPANPNWFLTQAFGNATVMGSTGTWHQGSYENMTFQLADWQLGIGVYMMGASGALNLLATAVLLVARRYNLGTSIQGRKLAVGLLGGPESGGPSVEESEPFMEGPWQREEGLEVWDEEITEQPPQHQPYMDAEERERAGSMPNYEASGGLKTSLLAK